MLKINLGNIYTPSVGDYLVTTDSHELYRIIKNDDNVIFVVNVETANIEYTYNNIKSLLASSMCNNMILISESEFELNRR